MMPRYYNSISDAVVASSRPIARARAATAARDARAAARNSDEARARDAARQAVRTENDLAAVVERAAEKVARLQINLVDAKAQSGRLADRAYATGVIHDDAARTAAQVAGLPGLIVRAESDLQDARDALASHRASMTPATAQPADIDPVDEPSRGRGRPRKAA